MKPGYVIFIAATILLGSTFNITLETAYAAEPPIPREDIIVGDYKDIYYLNETGWAYVHRHIFIRGDNLSTYDFPIEAQFMELRDSKVYYYGTVVINDGPYRDQVLKHIVGGKPNNLYSYIDIDIEVGFHINKTGKYNVTMKINCPGWTVYHERVNESSNKLAYTQIEVREHPPESIWLKIIPVVIIIIIITVVFRYSIRPIKNAHKKYIQDKLNEGKKQKEIKIDDLRSMIQIAYQRGGISPEEMQIFERRGKEIRLSRKEFQQLLHNDDER